MLEAVPATPSIAYRRIFPAHEGRILRYEGIKVTVHSTTGACGCFADWQARSCPLRTV